MTTAFKSINQNLILNLLRLHPGISRTQIANQTGLSKSTISSLLAKLISEGYVHETTTDARTASVGRPSVQLRLNSRIRVSIGIEFTGSECIGVVTDLYAEPIRSVREPTSDVSVPASVELIARVVDELLEGCNADTLLGIVVGVPGPVDVNGLTVVKAENIGWNDVPLGSLLQEKIGKPVAVVKRQNAGALGEYWYGAGRAGFSLLYISVGIGIGCGIVFQGRLYDGSNGSAGEIGHVTVEPNGHRCRCGNMGCLETVASRPAIAVRAIEKIKQTGRPSILKDWTKGVVESISGSMVLQAARQDDPVAVEAVQEAGCYLGIAIANLVNLFNPTTVILGGDVLDVGNVILDPVREVVQRRAFSIPLSAVQVVLSSLGDRAAAIGAARLAIDHLFANSNLLSDQGGIRPRRSSVDCIQDPGKSQ